MPDRRPHSPLTKLGAAIHLQRSRLRISQAEAGNRARMHRNYVGALERGEVNPTFSTLMRLADGLDISLDRLIQEAIEGDGEPPKRQRNRGRPRRTAAEPT